MGMKVMTESFNPLPISWQFKEKTILETETLRICNGLFERILKDKQYVGDTPEPTARLFAQFHAPQTSRMEREIIAE